MTSELHVSSIQYQVNVLNVFSICDASTNLEEAKHTSEFPEACIVDSANKLL